MQGMAALPESSNPFRPGPGTRPPVLAGRDEEKDVITSTLAKIAGPRDKDGALLTPIKLVGPSGTGKTTLLVYADDEAERQQIHVVHCASLRNCKGIDGFSTFIYDMLGDFEIEDDVAARLGGAYGESKIGAPEKRNIYRRVLKGLLAKKPVLFLFDEAMHYDKGLLALVLQENQELLSEGWPLAMIIAGTPVLDDFLSDVDAALSKSSHQMYIHRLSDEATRDALGQPFVDNGCQITDGALELMAGWTDNFSYFTQFAGQAVWDAMIKAKRTNVDKALAQTAEPAMHKSRDGYYSLLYLGLDNRRLLEHANHMVGIIESAQQPLVIEQACRRLEQAAGIDADGSYAACSHMQESNLFWWVENDSVEPTLPSFFSYFKARYAEGLG